MSSNQPVTYGSYEYAKNPSGAPGNLYANSFVPQTFNASFSESIAETDADIITATKVLTDALTLVDAKIITARKVLADSLTATSAIAITGEKALSESVSVGDTKAIIVATKQLDDLLILKEWISIRLIKAIVWTNPVNNANIFDSLYARTSKGPTVYGGKNILYGGLKPLASWLKGVKRQENWTQTDGHKYNS